MYCDLYSNVGWFAKLHAGWQLAPSFVFEDALECVYIELDRGEVVDDIKEVSQSLIWIRKP